MNRIRLPHLSRRSGAARVALGASLLLVLGPLGLGAQPATAAPGGATFVDLGVASTYSVLGGAGVTSTGGTDLALNLGLSATGTITGFGSGLGVVHGTIHDKDAAAAAAQTARNKAYGAAAGQDPIDEISGDLGGKTFLPGVHHSTAAVTNSTTITLDAQGDSSAVFVFQVDAALSAAANATVELANGALANNVFWQVVGAVSLGAGAHYAGTFLGAGAVSFGEGASLKGRILTPSTVTLANSAITQPIDDLTKPVVTINGGAAAATNDTTPTISGTTDEPAGQSVTVTVAGQTLTATVGVGGVWGVSTTTLSEGPHTVVASSTDASQNTGTATQVLTVDTAAPLVTIDGGPTRATNDTTPTISGTTTQTGNPTVTVTVGTQTLTPVAAAGGAWTVDAAALPQGPYNLVASVTDAAGNTGTDSQILTVDVTVPVVTIEGGASRSTSDTSPWVYGHTAEQAGTIVSVTLGGQSLTATVQPGGTWGVSAQTLATATYTVLASITDAAGNTGTATQSLQIGSAANDPTVTLDGGATRSTNDSTPTISGTTSLTGSPAVTVTVSGQTLTTPASGGTWSVTAAVLAQTSHTVMASVTANGTTGTATQVLTVDTGVPVLAIDGGASRSTTDPTPRVEGTTTEPVGATVQVTVGGQTLTTTVRFGGLWGVGADVLAENTYTVVASITDAASNTGYATQTLVVSGVAPAPGVTIDGGANSSTNDTTPTISGTSDAPVNTPVSVTVDSQTLTASVGAGGLWSTQPTQALAETAHTVVASVTDGGTTDTASQVLKVDLTAPGLSIDGGAARSTTDTTPRVQGTTAEPVGTAVLVTVGGQSLTTTVKAGGTWGVGADTLALGDYAVVASITDAAHNTTVVTQTLTIAAVTPPVTPPVTPTVTPTVTTPVTTPVATSVTIPAERYKPDAEIRLPGGKFAGGDEYGASKQSATEKLGAKDKSVTFEIRLTNRGDVADSLDVLGAPKSSAFKVAYFAAGKNVTAAVLAGTYRTASLKPGDSVLLTVKITKAKGAKKGSKGSFDIRAASAGEAASHDTVTAVVKAG
jgi:ice-binding like protein/Big-like domain-containing protein